MVRQSNLEIVSNMHHVKVNLGSGTEDVKLHASHSTMKAVQSLPTKASTMRIADTEVYGKKLVMVGGYKKNIQASV